MADRPLTDDEYPVLRDAYERLRGIVADAPRVEGEPVSDALQETIDRMVALRARLDQYEAGRTDR